MNLWQIFINVVIKGKAQRLPRGLFFIYYALALAFFFGLGSLCAYIDSPVLYPVELIIVVCCPAFVIRLMVLRLHDTNRSGFYWFIGLIPVIGTFLLLFTLFLEPGTNGRNNYGTPFHYGQKNPFTGKEAKEFYIEQIAKNCLVAKDGFVGKIKELKAASIDLTHNSSVNYGLALYQYGAMVLRDKMHENKSLFVEFDDKKLCVIFADKAKLSPSSFAVAIKDKTPAQLKKLASDSLGKELGSKDEAKGVCDEYFGAVKEMINQEELPEKDVASIAKEDEWSKFQE